VVVPPLTNILERNIFKSFFIYKKKNFKFNFSDQSSLIYPLSNEILNSILSTDNLKILTNYFKLNNKFDQVKEQNELYDNEHLLRQNHEHIYILSSPETNHTEQIIISSLHSSMTNGDSIYTQAKVDKVSPIYDNTNRYLKGNHSKLIILKIEIEYLFLFFPDIQSPSKVQKKVNTTQPPPPPPPSKTIHIILFNSISF
jgi:hypothetical protein